ncbi:MAG: tautomerase family protein [Deferrisomatales bacterium]|nr:tautomerase family protein [Deferrisomatales bacterium]
MPVVHFYGPQLPREKKQQLVKEFAEAVSRATGIPVEKMVTYVHELDPENIGLGGDLLANRK